MRLGFWRKCQRIFRWLRITALLLVLAAACAVLWFNRVGLPDFVKTRVIATLRARGVELDFVRLRLRFMGGLVAENVRIGDARTANRPVLSLAAAQLRLNFGALFHRQLQVDGLVLRQGRLVWPFSPTNTFTFDNIQTELRFQTNDTWSLDNFQADFAGVKLALAGDIAHAPEILHWEMFHGRKATNGTARTKWPAQLQKFSDALGQVHFAGAPRLSLVVNGDARDLRSFTARLNVNANAVQTPWFSARDLQLAANLGLAGDGPTNFEISPAWWSRARPAIRLEGHLALTNGVVLGAALDLAHTHFSYSNLVWHLPDLALAQAKTHLEIDGSADEAAGDYRCRIRGAFDPETVRPFLTDSNAAHGFEIVQFTEPLALDVEAGGHWHDYAGITAEGRVALTNFTVRGEAFGDVTATLHYAGRVLEVLHPLMHTGAQMMTADAVTLDFNTRMIYFTNGFSTTDPGLVTRAIGPKTARLVEPYHFVEPPTARVHGQIPLRNINHGDMAEVDMWFEVIRGAPFEWLKFRTPDITGIIHWRDETLTLTNVATAFYGGTGTGFAGFDFSPDHPGADYEFALDVTNVNLHLLAADLGSPTNHLEGTLAGQLVVTKASTESVETWNGHGRAGLHDGLLWDLPLFGILSPALNLIAPGLGSSRATDASGKFTITNGVIFTDSLTIRSTMARLQYAGTIDMKQGVDARVTAQLLRDTPLIGPLISTVLWPVSKVFEYKVTGTLKEPKSEPVHVPGLLLLPLHPIRMLEGMFPNSPDPLTVPEN